MLSLLILLTGCQTAAFEAITPEVIEYSPDVQQRAAEELQAMPLPCPRDVVIAGCSAVHRMIKDYGLTRDRIRAVEP